MIFSSIGLIKTIPEDVLESKVKATCQGSWRAMREPMAPRFLPFRPILPGIAIDGGRFMKRIAFVRTLWLFLLGMAVCGDVAAESKAPGSFSLCASHGPPIVDEDCHEAGVGCLLLNQIEILIWSENERLLYPYSFKIFISCEQNIHIGEYR